MFDIISKKNMDNMFDDMWSTMDSLFRNPLVETGKTLSKGLFNIQRPHNLYTYKDSDGNIVGNKLEVCTTPFKKDEVEVDILQNILTVKCGSENKKDEERESCVYHGISSQAYQFSLKLSDKVDLDKIEAKNEDGILTIKMPFKEVRKEEEPKRIKIL